MPLLLAHLTFSALSLKMTSIHTAHRNRKVCNYYMKRNRAENGWSWSWSWSWSGCWSWSYSNTTSMDAAIDFKKQLQVSFSFSFFSRTFNAFCCGCWVLGFFNWPTLNGTSSNAAHSWAPLLFPLHRSAHCRLPSVSPFLTFSGQANKMSEFCLLLPHRALANPTVHLVLSAPGSFSKAWMGWKAVESHGGLGMPRKPLIRQISRLVLARIIEKLSAQRVHSHTTRTEKWGGGGSVGVCQPQSGSSELAIIVGERHQVGLDKSWGKL